jgi:uncharacterized membrane protein
MSHLAHLWVIGYDSPERAAGALDKIMELAADCLALIDIAVIHQDADGKRRLERPAFPASGNVMASAPMWPVGYALGSPLECGAAVNALLGSSAEDKAIDQKFLDDACHLIQPGNSAIVVLDDEGNMEKILRGIEGMGGTILKTNVDLERAKLVQEKLLAKSRGA